MIKTLIILGVLLVGIPLGLVLLMVAEVVRVIRDRGIWMLIIGIMIGRHYSGHHHTNATFWRDSNGKVKGNPQYRVASRHHRAGVKNLGRALLALWILIILTYGEIRNYRLTSILAVSGVLFCMGLWCLRTYRKARKWYRNRTIVSPLAKGLAPIADTSEADMERAITLRDDWREKPVGDIGQIRFPDTFLGSEGETQVVDNYIQRRFPRLIETEWNYKKMTVIIRAVQPFPDLIRFSDRLSDIQACKPREYIGGYDKRNEPVILSHAGDAPMKGYCMNTGTGKTVRVLSTAAQLLSNDPYSTFVGFDVKQVSLLPLEVVPGVTIYNDPFNMREMWDGWYEILAEMNRRYEEKKRTGTYTGGDKYIFLEEGNTFAILIKSYYMNERRDKGQPANPPIWSEAIAPILFQGREVGIFVSAMLQNFMEKYFGNMSLRPAFNTIGMAGFKASQYRTIVGQSPAPKCIGGQGKLLICEPDREVWVQGLYDNIEWLMQYATERRSIAT